VIITKGKERNEHQSSVTLKAVCELMYPWLRHYYNMSSLNKLVGSDYNVKTLIHDVKQLIEQETATVYLVQKFGKY